MYNEEICILIENTFFKYKISAIAFKNSYLFNDSSLLINSSLSEFNKVISKGENDGNKSNKKFKNKEKVMSHKDYETLPRIVIIL